MPGLELVTSPRQRRCFGPKFLFHCYFKRKCCSSQSELPAWRYIVKPKSQTCCLLLVHTTKCVRPIHESAWTSCRYGKKQYRVGSLCGNLNIQVRLPHLLSAHLASLLFLLSLTTLACFHKYIQPFDTVRALIMLPVSTYGWPFFKSWGQPTAKEIKSYSEQKYWYWIYASPSQCYAHLEGTHLDIQNSILLQGANHPFGLQ